MLNELQMVCQYLYLFYFFAQEPTENYTDVDLSFTYDYVRERCNFTDYQDLTAFGSTWRFSLYMGIVCQMHLGSPQIQEFIK
jgi:hypothetical protein